MSDVEPRVLSEDDFRRRDAIIAAVQLVYKYGFVDDMVELNDPAELKLAVRRTYSHIDLIQQHARKIVDVTTSRNIVE